MISRIELVNFMSHKHTVLDLAEGLTVLVGDNNCGKSAVVSALQILCQNAQGDFMVRHGERDCIVHVETDDGHVIEWRRCKNVVSYNIDGRDIHRLSGSVPDDLHEKIKLSLVDAQGGAFDVHFGEQKSPIFLLDQPAGRRATFFASSSDAVRLIEMQALHRRKVHEHRTRERDLVRRKAESDARINLLAPLELIEPKLRSVEKLFDSIQRQTTTIAAMDALLSRTNDAISLVQYLCALASAFDILSPPPTLGPTDHLATLIQQIGTYAKRTQIAQGEIAALAPLKAPPKLERCEPLQRLIDHIETQSTRIECNDALRRVFKELLEPPELKDPAPLRRIINDLANAMLSHRFAVARRDALQLSSPPPMLADTQALRGVIQHLEHLSQRSAAMQEMVDLLAEIAVPPPLTDPRALNKTIADMSVVLFAVAGERDRMRALDRLVTPPRLKQEEPLRQLVNALEDANQAVVDRLEILKDVDVRLSHAESDVRQAIEESNTCPLCGGTINADRLIKSAAAQGRREI